MFGSMLTNMKIIALIASVITAFQAVYGMINGSAICPNAGCKTVERLTVISPFYINWLGFCFFQAVFWGLRFQAKLAAGRADPMAILLVCGLVFDSVLLAYQVFVAQTFCGYCLLVFGLVLLLNILYGQRQTLLAMAVTGMTVFSFSLLMFIPTRATFKTEPLKTAAYGMKSCSAPTKEIHLIFSSNCPYCENVLQALGNCNSCDLYLNPIDAVYPLGKGLEKMAIEHNPTFSPEINRLVLGVLGIDTVPVLVVNSTDGYRLIKGESKIINYIRHACFTTAEVFYYNPADQSTDKEMTLLSEDEGACTVAVDCKP